MTVLTRAETCCWLSMCTFHDRAFFGFLFIHCWVYSTLILVPNLSHMNAIYALSFYSVQNFVYYYQLAAMTRTSRWSLSFNFFSPVSFTNFINYLFTLFYFSLLFRLFVYLFIHSFIFRYFFVYLFTHLFIFIYFYVSLFIYLFIRSFIYFSFLFRLFIYFHLFIFLCLYVYLFIYSLIYLFFLYFTVYLFIPSFIYFSSFFLYLFIHSFTFPLNFVYLFIYILYALPFCQYTRHPCKVSFRDSISHSICQVLSVRYLDNINN